MGLVVTTAADWKPIIALSSIILGILLIAAAITLVAGHRAGWASLLLPGIQSSRTAHRRPNAAERMREKRREAERHYGMHSEIDERDAA